MGQPTMWRLCKARPEVGFDFYWSWEPLPQTLESWARARLEPDAELLSVERSRGAKVERFEIDHEAWSAELARHRGLGG